MNRKNCSILLCSFIVIFAIIASFHESHIGKWFDTEVYVAIISTKSHIMTSFFTAITRIGEVSTIVVLSLLLLGYLLIKKRHLAALFFTIVMILAGSLNPLLKNIFDRERPSILRLVDIGGFSFPSGHAMGATAFFGSVIFLALRKLKKAAKYTIVVLSTLLIVLIATSRIYLGVHYPTDVIAGISAGMACILVTQLMLHPKLHNL